MKWVTRKNASVDRIACPWLVKRFIDPEAEFLVRARARDVTAIAERVGAIPYDVGGVELGHVDGRCSFESIILKYGLRRSRARPAGADRARRRRQRGSRHHSRVGRPQGNRSRVCDPSRR